MKSVRASCEPVHSRERVLHLLRAVGPRDYILSACETVLQGVEPRLLCGRRPSMIAAAIYYFATQTIAARNLGRLPPDDSAPPTYREALDLFGSDSSDVSARHFIALAIVGSRHECGADGCRRLFSTPRPRAYHRFMDHGIKDPGFHGCLECRCALWSNEREESHAWEVHEKPRLMAEFEKEKGRKPAGFMEFDLWMRGLNGNTPALPYYVKTPRCRNCGHTQNVHTPAAGNPKGASLCRFRRRKSDPDCPCPQFEAA